MQDFGLISQAQTIPAATPVRGSLFTGSDHVKERTAAIPANPCIAICSRNPVATWAIGDLLTKSSFSWSVMKLVTGSVPITSKGLQILLVDVPSIPEWPELVPKWTSAGCRAILLMAEGWGLGGAQVRALGLGVSGIVRVAAKFGEELGAAISMVTAGHLYVKDHTLCICGRGFQPGDSGPCIPNLSFREEQVLDLVKLGFTNRRIGILLGIRERTAKFHVGNILRKMNVKRRKDVVSIDKDLLEKLGPVENAQVTFA